MKYDIFAKDMDTIKQLQSHLGIEPDYDGPVAYFSGIDVSKVTQLSYLRENIEIRDQKGRIIYPEVKIC